MTNMMRRKQQVRSSETDLVYKLKSKIGEGGFGEVYLAAVSPRREGMPTTVCLKVSPHLSGWMQEARFAQLLTNESRVIRVFDAFPIIRRDGTVLYCLALEYAEHGDLQNYLRTLGAGLSESVVRREIRGIVKVLVRLGGWQGLHRDLTPFNIFVTSAGRLKVGDFGIAKHSDSDHGVIARTMNPFIAPTSILAGEAHKWQAKDDLYQVGQLLAMMIARVVPKNA
jgi:serine/threonine protein kinase